MLSSLIKMSLTLALLTPAVCANAATTADVLVRPTSEVSAADIKLADIAAVRCADKGLVAKLQAISVCPSPLAGRVQSISRNQILTALRRQGLANSANLLSPAQVSVSRTSLTVTGQTMFEAVRQFALDRNLYPGATVEIEAVRLPRDQVVPAGQAEVRVSDKASTVRKGRNTLPVDIVVDGKIYTSVHIPVQVRVFAQTVVATKTISKSDHLTAENTTVENREITTMPEDVLTELPGGDVVASARVPEGTPLRRCWVAEPPVIRAGDAVIVSAVGDAVRVSEKGTAVSDGRTGEMIKVRLGAGSREVRGTVAGPGLIEIQIGKRS